MIFILLSPKLIFCEGKGTVEFRDFSGGVNDVTPAIYLQKNESPNAKNVVVDETPGLMTKRKGASEFGRLPVNSTGTFIGTYRREDGTEYLAVRSSATLYLTRDGATYTEVRDKLNPNFSLDCETIYGEYWCVDGSTWAFRVFTTSSDYFDSSPATEAMLPRGYYIEFEDNAVWVARTTSSASDVYFSRLTDDSGFEIKPSTSGAWVGTNVIRVSPNDGDIIFGIKRYRGDIFVFKSKSIFRIFGDNEDNFGVARITDKAGTLFNDTIKEDDRGILTFLGEDGMYQFDGVKAERISDKFRNGFKKIHQPKTNQQQKVWTTQIDFGVSGTTFFNMTSSRTTGNLELLETDGFDTFTDGNYSSNPPWTLIKGSMTVAASTLSIDGSFSITGSNANLISTLAGPKNSTGTWSFDFIFPSSSIPPSGRFAETWVAPMADGENGYSINLSNTPLGRSGSLQRVSKLGVNGATDDCINSGATIVSFSINKDSASHTVKMTRNANSLFEVFIDGASKGTGTNSFFTNNSSMVVCMESNGASTLQADFPALDNFRIAVSSGYYISQIYDTGGSIDSWDVINWDTEAGQASGQVFLRSSADSGLVGASWGEVAPGAIIDTATANRYIQWMTSATARNPVNLTFPTMHSLTINWNKTGNSTRAPSSQMWNSRLWVSVSTEGTSNNQVTWVRSKLNPFTWIPYEGMNIKDMTVFQDNLYAVDSSTNRIVRLDNGDNDFGSGIDAFWETKDEVWGKPMFRKGLTEMGVDMNATGAGNLNVDFSTSSGVYFTTNTVSMVGNGRVIRRVPISESSGFQYRFRFRNTAAAQDFNVVGLEADATLGEVRNP